MVRFVQLCTDVPGGFVTNDEMYAELARAITRFDRTPLPPEVSTRARTVVLDTLAVIIRGFLEPDVAALARGFATQAGGATVFTQPPRRVDPLRAILANTSAAAALELVEGNRFSKGHVALQVLPALLAAADREPRPGERFLAAFVLGYEIAARMGAAAERNFRTFGHGMWAAAGSAAAIAHLAGRIPERTVECVKIASNLSLAPAFVTHAEGATVRNLTAGCGAMIGALVPEMEAAGYTGSTAAMAVTLGESLGSRFAPERFVRGFGTEFLLMSNYFKLEASGRHVHPATGALQDLLERTPLDPQAIEAIEVATYDPAAQLANQAPVNGLAAKTSIPFSIAARLTFGELGPDVYTQDRVTDRRVRALMRRVNVVLDPAAGRDGRALRSASIRVRLTDGSELRGYCENPRGDFDFPATAAELDAKYQALTRPAIGQAASNRLRSCIERLESVADVGAELRAAVAPG
jgi:2-methylcitrate dehydratase PrpD